MGFVKDHTALLKGIKKSPENWEEAKAYSLDVKLPQMLSSIEAWEAAGKDMDKWPPSAWISKLGDNGWCIQWRVKNKPVFFNDINKNSKGWFPLGDKATLDDAKKAIHDLAEDVKSGAFDKQIQEAWDRPSKTKKVSA